MSTPIDLLLSRLHHIKTQKPNKAGYNQWQALCPSHPDTTPSLTITECSDGTVLVKCWAGCSANEIVKALGLELKNLFPCTPLNNKPTKPQPSQRAIAHERLIISIAEGNFSKGVTLSNEDMARYRLALKRLKEIN
ncbi:virulence-associated protein E [Gammaproteobacteria bacterium ESL0073]|nr:virulence-associated protein E [Gammaproteobacteria bacterium ESL0073]